MKAICTTTINPPTEATLRFAEIAERDGWEFIIAGDMKTPHTDYYALMRKYRSVRYLDPQDQVRMDSALSEAIGFNCIQRRNFAFIEASRLGAEIVASVDDDNIPLDGWGRNLMLGKTVVANYHEPDDDVFDPISAAGYPKLWHRGFPLQLLKSRRTTKSLREVRVDIQADFWAGDPDIDAICRMEHAPDCQFKDEYFPIASSKPSPFNSQNTFLTANILPHYFMHVDVGRYDDIIAAYHVQSLGFRVVYGAASVIQKRNDHDLMVDFKREMWGQENMLGIIRAMEPNHAWMETFLTARACTAFRLYQEHFAKQPLDICA